MIYKIAIFLPFMSFLVLGAYCISKPKCVPKKGLLVLSSSVMFLSFLFSLFGLYLYNSTSDFMYFQKLQIVNNWINVAGFKQDFSIFVDLLSVIMLVLTTGISFLVHLYSISYMEKDESKVRFFAYLDLFTFVMVYFVSSFNLFNMFIAWEGLAFSSYLLIAFNSEKAQSVISGTKAFLVNRVSDLAFIAVLLIVYSVFKTFDLIEIFNNRSLLTQQNANVLAVLILIAALIKSAQLGFQTWIAEAMQAPTPASVLIHSSTLVSAGVILLCRTNFIFESSSIKEYMAMFALLSSVVTALIAANQKDIKKILAYSTSSQLGFMIFACGIGAYAAAVFHLVTHALFKALLFMGAGDIILQNKGEHNIFIQKISKNSYMFLFLMMWIGMFSLMGLPPFNGFFSKESVFISGIHNSSLGLVALSVTFFTAIYASRLMFVLFDKAKDSKKFSTDIKLKNLIAVPMLVLALFTGIGSVFVDYFDDMKIFGGVLRFNAVELCQESKITMLLSLLSVVLVCFGIVLTYMYSVKKSRILVRLILKNKGWTVFLAESLYLDHLYSYLFVKPTLIIAKICRYFENFFSNRVIESTSLEMLNLIRHSSRRRKEFVVANTGVVVFGLAFVLGVYIVLLILNSGVE